MTSSHLSTRAGATDASHRYYNLFCLLANSFFSTPYHRLHHLRYFFSYYKLCL
ncbi:hypothetical protein CLOAM0152 [Candidatus Cloacimonas acidaminovorans str. Evry]|uniref:Uncharacterized protein n=1 Tax=Cloacimonas acidaminovorans (strain Evry) TaxID=459349 RepID=B0VJ02_CLOAI|nr:hypothetical protein CLOAM0152 [Candidatus Cloacimonas acidaminovorans str. Evry]